MGSQPTKLTHSAFNEKEIERLAKEADSGEAVPYPDQINPFEKYNGLSMFLIKDFALTSMKTFKNRKSRRILVGEAEQSVEMVPNDIVYKQLQSNYSASGSGIIKYSSALDFSSVYGSDFTIESTRKQDIVNPNKIEILVKGIFEIEIAYGATSISNIEAIRFAIERNGTPILQDKQARQTPSIPPTTISGYRKQAILLNKGDLLEFIMNVDYLGSGSLTLDSAYTYRGLNYLKSNR